MKKRILAFAVCICLMLTVFNSISPLHVAHGAECSCGALDSVVHTAECQLETAVCDCGYADSEHTAECAVTTAVCTCGALSAVVHTEQCTINCTCGNTTTHAETCPVYNCGCPDTDSDGKRDHVNTCRLFKQVCQNVGCTDPASTNAADHGIGCPMRVTNEGKYLQPQICESCGWLFGEHYRYCRSTYNSAFYNSLSEVTGHNVYMPGNYGSAHAGGHEVIAVDTISARKDELGLSDSDVATILAAENVNSKVYYYKLQVRYGAPQGSYDIHIPEGVVCVIDLNGKNIWGHGDGPAITNYGTLILLDTGTDSYTYEGTMHDRGYYYYDDDAGVYFNSVRNAQRAVWKQGVENSANVSESEKTFVKTGLIYGGRTTRNNTTSGGTYLDSNNKFNIESGRTYEELLAASQSTVYDDYTRAYFTYLIENSKIRNRYGFGGGGVHNEGTFVMNGGTIAGCESMEGEGAAVLTRGKDSSFIMNGGSIRYNFGSTTITAEKGATVDIRNGDIFRNVSIGNGAIHGDSTDDADKITLIVGEETDTADVEAMADTYLPESLKAQCLEAKGTMSNILDNNLYKNYTVPVIAYNRSYAGIMTDGNGAGIYAESVNLYLNSAIIMENWAHYRGGGVDIFNEGNVELSGNILIKNNYCEYKGGGISVRNPSQNSNKLDLFITSDTVKIIGNKAGYGGGLHISYGDFDISAGLVEGNVSTGYYVLTNNYGYTLDGEYNSRQIINFDGSVNAIDTIYKAESEGVPYASGRAGGGVYIEGTGNAVISGTTKITNNIATYYGAGLYSNGGPVTMNGGEISHNVIKKSFSTNGDYTEDGMVYDTSLGFSGVENSRGAGVCIKDAQFVMNDGSISYNEVWGLKGDGGGVYIDADYFEKVAFEMNGGEISYNYNYDDQGGGVIIFGKGEMNGGSIHHNQTRDNGGGIYASGAFDLTGGEIYNNTVHNYIGGGVYMTTCEFNMTGGSIYNNVALRRNGGGVYIRESDFTMTGGEIYENHADGEKYTFTNAKDIGTQYGSGGGICVQNSNVSITGQSVIRDNTAAYKGGAIYAFRNLESKPCQIVIGEVDGDNATQPQIYSNSLLSQKNGNYVNGGGAMCVEGKDLTLTINSGKIYSNKTPNIDYIVGGGLLVLDDVESENSDSPALRGAATVNINGGEFYSNRSSKDQAGFVYIKANGVVNVNDGDFHDNVAADNGGFAYVSGGTLNIYGGNIRRNQATNWIGGAFCIATGTVNMYGGNIYENKVAYASVHASHSHGGAIYITNGIFNMYGGKIYNNTTGAGGNGGAVCLISTNNLGAFNMYGGEVSGNTAKGRGGAIFLNNGSVVIGKPECDGSSDDLHNTKAPTESACGHPVIKDNTSASLGGSVCVLNGTATFYCGEMTGNTATTKGGGLYVENGTVNIVNGNISANTTQSAPYGNTVYMAGGTVTYVDGSSFEDTVNSNTGVVVTKGTLTKKNDANATPVNSLYFTDREDNDTTYPFIVPMGEQIVLPEGTDVMGTRANHTFIGWQYPDVSDFTRKPSDYMFAGEPIDVDDNVSADNMTLYGVWANSVNSISYYKTYAEKSKYTDGYTTSYNYQTASSSKFSLPAQAPVLAPGYTFEGWTMQQGESCALPCNANWSISLAGDSKMPGDEFETQGKFGNLHFTANWSATINYNVVGNGTIANATLSGKKSLSEAIEITKGMMAAAGVTPTADENHIFVGWYADAECHDLISTDIGYKPTLNADGYYDYLNYYAKFEIQYTDLIITTSGADTDQSFVFTVTGTPFHTDEPFTMQVFVIGGNNSVTVKHIPAGNYDVYENNYTNAHQGDKWTWRYEDTQSQNTDVNNVKDGIETSVDEVTFYYNNKKTIANWLSGVSKKLYTLIMGN